MRGEVHFALGGKPYRLCLTLGALAEIEAGLGADSLEALDEKLARLTGRGLVTILAALLRGGGHAIEEATLAAQPIDVLEAGRAIAAAFRAAGLGAAGEAPPGEAQAPPETTRSGGAGLPLASAPSISVQRTSGG